MVFLFEDKQDVIPVMQRTANLEYDNSSTIKKLTSKKSLKIGFLAGHGEPDFQNLKAVRSALQKQYELLPVNLSGNKPVPDDISALMIIGPTTKLAEHEKYHIDQYIMRGGKVAFLLNKVNANLQTKFAQAVDAGLDDMLQQYGVKVNNDLVRDAQCATVTVSQQESFFTIQNNIPFPYLPMGANFDKNSIIVKDLQNVIFFFVSSIDTSQIASKGLKADVLVRSSKRSGRQVEFFMIDPMQRFSDEMFKEPNLPLAVAVEGKLQSFYAGKPVPTDTSVKTPPPISTSRTSGTTSPDTRIIVVGDGDFMRDEYLGNRDNLNFFANMVDYLVDDAGLITIRSRDTQGSPLEEVSSSTKQFVKWADLLVPPLGVVLYGLIRWRLRAARKRAMQIASS
jgi:gliding-associated putative ABC transporter substrate-binding component GldG